MDETPLDASALDGLEGVEHVLAAAPAAARSGAWSTRALAAAGLVVTAASLGSRILGYVRLVVVARSVPSVDQGASLDAFTQAFKIPDFLFQLVAAGALASALVPVLAALFATGEDRRAWRVVSTVTTLVLGALVALVLVAEAIAPALVSGVVAPGFTGPKLQMTIDLTRVMLLGPLFMAGGAIASAVLNARGRFAAAAVAPLVYNLGIIGGAVFLVPVMGVEGLAVGVVVGAVGLLAVQLPGLASVGTRLAPSLDVRDEATSKALVLMVPRAIGLGAAQVALLVITSLATGLPDGSVYAFNAAFTLLQIPIGVLGVPLGTVLLPSLSRVAASGEVDEFRRLLVRGLGMLAYVMLGLSALGVPLAGDVTRVTYGLSGLHADAMGWIATSLAVFMLGLTAHSMIAILARAFYAMQDTTTPLLAAVAAVVLNIVVGVLLVGPLGLAGLAASIAVGAWLEVAWLVIMLMRRTPGLRLGGLWRGMALTAVAAVPGVLVAVAAESALGAYGAAPGGTLVSLGRLLLVTAAGGLAMLAASLALRIEEPRRMLGIVLDLMRRRGRG